MQRTDRVLAGARRLWREQWPLLVLAALCLLGAAVVAPWDGAISDAVRHDRGWGDGAYLRQVLGLVRPFGKADVAVVAILVAGALGWRLRAQRALVALLLVGLVVLPLKVVIDRTRPSGDPYSMPSGDTATAGALLALAGASPASRAVALGVAGGVGLSRLHRGRHYPSDVLVGLAIALLAVAVSALRVRRRWPRWTRRRLALAALAIAAIAVLAAGGKVRRPPVVATMVYGPAALLALAVTFGRPLGRRLSRAPDRLPRPGRRAAILLALGAIGALLWLASVSSLWDRDEPRFSRATVEMVRSGDYLVPTFNGRLRPDKPILIYWLMSIPVRLLGVTEVAVRAVAPFGMAAAALATFALGTQLVGSAIGWLAALILLLTPLTLVTGTAATTDALLLAWIAASLWWFERTSERGWNVARAAVLALLLAGAQLTKGPVGLAVPLLAILTRAWIGRRSLPPEPGRWRYVGLAALASVALFLAWAIPANQATGGAFAQKGIGHHVVGRSLNPLEGHGGPFLLSLPFYAIVIPVGFVPWTLYLPAALSALAGGRVGGARGRALLGGWLVSTFVLMTLVATKLPHYIQPVWPVLALSVAATVSAALWGRLAARDRRWLRGGRWLLGLLFLPLGLALVVAPWFLPAPTLRYPCVAAGLLLLVWTPAALREQRTGRHVGAVGTLVCGMLLLVALAGSWLLPAVETYKVSRPLARAIAARTGRDVPVVVRKYKEPSLIFYLDRGPVEALSEPALASWLQDRGPSVLVITRRALERFRAGHPGPDPFARLERIATLRGFNYSKGRWVEVIAFGRELPPRSNDEAQPR